MLECFCLVECLLRPRGRAALAEAEETAREARLVDDAMGEKISQARQRAHYKSMDVRTCAEQVLRVDPAVERLVRRFRDVADQYVRLKATLAWLQSSGALTKEQTELCHFERAEPAAAWVEAVAGLLSNADIELPE